VGDVETEGCTSRRADPLSWRRRVTHSALCWALPGLVCASLVLCLSPALAAWGPTIPVSGPRIEGLVFDHRNVPWATFVAREARRRYGGKQWAIARLTSNDRFKDVHVVPGVRHEVEEIPPDLVLGPTDRGELLMQFTYPEPAPAGDTPFGVAAGAWRPGAAVSRFAPLTRGLSYRFGGSPRLAINAAGTAVVLWSQGNATVEFARLVDGRLLGVQKVGLAVKPEQRISGEEMQVAELTPVAGPSSAVASPSRSAGFRAAWVVGPNIETTEAGPEGIFSAPVASPWPGFPLPYSKLVSDAHGDQTVLWSQSTGEHSSNLYVISRRAGQRFGAPQLLGHDGMPPTAVMDPSGRITVMWRQELTNTLFAAAGYAGQPLGSARSIWVAKTGSFIEDVKIVVTASGRVVAVWGIGAEPGGRRSLGVEAATSPDGVHFGAPHHLLVPNSQVRQCSVPLLVPDRTGGAFVGMSCELRGQSINEYARYRP
jgi:hypothetical protein